jgi:uroporphyrinogen-III synthase
VADAAVAAGYRRVSTIGPDEHLLAEYLATILPAGSRIISYCSARTSRRIDDRLIEAGHDVRRIIPYEAVELPCPIGRDAALTGIDGIVVHSRTSAVALSAMLRGTDWRGTIWCISKAAAEPLAGLARARVMIASAPHEAALMALIGRHRPMAAVRRAGSSRFRRLLAGTPHPANDDPS